MLLNNNNHFILIVQVSLCLLSPPIKNWRTREKMLEFSLMLLPTSSYSFMLLKAYNFQIVIRMAMECYVK